jgi:hypothetical protein
MPKTAASEVAWAGRTAYIVLVLAVALAVALAGCSGAGSGTKEGQAKAASSAPPKAEDDHATTVEGRDVRVEMVANDTGDSLRIKAFDPGKIMGAVGCEQPMLSCDYIAAPGFTGEEKFGYTVEDAQGRTDTATVYVTVKPEGGSGKGKKPPIARDDHATTSEGREVMIEMVANDSGKDLEIDRVKPGNTHGDIICDADVEAGRMLSCAYTPVKGFTGTDEFEYTAKDVYDKTDDAKVVVEVRPAN